MHPDQERIQSLLKDTVSLLCKNGLHYNAEIKVEGLIGVTLDNHDVFLIHLNEKIDNENVALAGATTVEMQNFPTTQIENSKSYCVKEKPVENFTNSVPQTSSLLQSNDSSCQKRILLHTKKSRKRAKKSKISKENQVVNSEANVNLICKTETNETLIISDEELEDDEALKSENCSFHNVSTIDSIPKKEPSQVEEDTGDSQENDTLNLNEQSSQIDDQDMKPLPIYSGNELPGNSWENQTPYLDAHQDNFSQQQFNQKSEEYSAGLACNQKTRRPSSMKVYVKELCHECELCGKQYYHSGDLRRHERTIHKMKKITVNGSSYFQKVD